MSKDFPDDIPGEGSFPASLILPLHRNRVKKILEDHNWSYQVNREGDIGGSWQHGTYFFQITGENDSIFCIRGTWRGHPELDDFILLNSLCNRWNTDYYWPKVYARVTDDRRVYVHTELPISYRNGVSDAQLDEHVHCALESSEDFFESLAKQIPHAVESNSEDEAPPED